ncbi:MAG: glycosyltransferase family 2 protein [Gemmatimonadetes bacterium]|nr:glycosyltransferase family 2 protein [Gemmatimonadota bacterium]
MRTSSSRGRSGNPSPPAISVVCPFYNEEAILADSVTRLLERVDTLPDPCEVIIVDDGSTDRSLAIAQDLARRHAALRVVTYAANRGRGYALRAGIEEARGDLVITTEIDLSWGDDIVHRLTEALRSRPDADIVVASPHLSGGGYVGVPAARARLSAIGNRMIRIAAGSPLTMHTGMTRGYRRGVIQALPLSSDGKEIHVEILSKALALGYRVHEIPAVLRWDAHKLARGARRRSSTPILHTIVTHLTLAAGVAPFRYLFVASALLAVGGGGFMGGAVYSLLTDRVAIFLAIVGFFLGLFAFLVLAVGILAGQNSVIQRELSRLQMDLRRARLQRPHE